MMRLGMHPRGFAPRLQNLPEIRNHLLPRLVRQAERTGDAELRDLYDELVSYGPPLQPVEPDPTAVALTVSIDHQGDRLRLFNTITTFGAAFDITLDDLAVETYFPADEATVEILRARAT